MKNNIKGQLVRSKSKPENVYRVIQAGKKRLKLSLQNSPSYFSCYCHPRDVEPLPEDPMHMARAAGCMVNACRNRNGDAPEGMELAAFMAVFHGGRKI